MKGTQFSSSIRAGLQIIIVLAIVIFTFGSSGTTIVYADTNPANDEFANATAIGGLPYNQTLDTTQADQELGEPELGLPYGGCEGKLLRIGLATVWYTYNPGASNVPVYISTAGSTAAPPHEYDTYIAVFTGSALDALTLVACNDSPNDPTNQAKVAFYALAGTTYHIQVAEYNGELNLPYQDQGYNGGTLVLNASVGLTISGNLGIGGTSGARAAYPGGYGVANSNGDYILAIPSGFTETVTPQLADAAFTPPSRTYNNVVSNLTGQNYTVKRLFSLVKKWITAFDSTHGWTVQDYVRTVGDVNGDGKDDVVGFGLDGVYIGPSNGSAFTGPTKWTSSFDLTHGWTVQDYVRTVGDVNGDGKDDLVGFGLDGVYIGVSTGSAFNTASKWTASFDRSHGWTVQDYVRTVGDVNGDGKDDLVGFGLDGVYVGISTGSAFNAAAKWTPSFDLSHGWTVQGYVRTVGDVNGDGKADVVGFGLDGVYVGLSTGSAFNAPTKWISAFDQAHGWTVQDYVRTVGDMNGDGKDDLVGFGLDGVYVALSTGTAFAAASKWTSAYDLSHGWTVQGYVRTVGDVNGDALADLVGFGLDGVYISK